MFFQLNERDIAKGADFGQGFAQDAYAFFALGAPHIVLAGPDFVPDHGVADYELNAGRELRGFVLQRAAIEQQGVRSPSVTRNKLIHDANTGTNKFVLGLLAEAS